MIALKEGDRIRVLRGKHEGRTGTVSILNANAIAKYLNIREGYALVALDGEPGQGAAGGRGGASFGISIEDLELYDGPAGLASTKEQR